MIVGLFASHFSALIKILQVTPFSAEAKQLIDLLRSKAPESDLDTALTVIRLKAEQSEDSAHSSDPALPGIDAFFTTICYIGSKSLSHVLSFIERNKERLVAMSNASPAARDQIITSVVDYWSDVQPGVAVNIVDKLLNYTVLTPASVIEWALAQERLDGGRKLAETWIYEMVSGTVAKVSNRVRQVVNARLQAGVRAEQAAALETALVTEREGLRRLFATIDDALVGVADGSSDAALDGMDQDTDVDRSLLRLWGLKWRRVFARKLAVEEAVATEGVKHFAPPAEDEVMGETEAVAGNGADAELNGNHENGNGVDLDIL